jgi:hypothetical protein
MDKFVRGVKSVKAYTRRGLRSDIQMLSAAHNVQGKTEIQNERAGPKLLK